MSEQFSVDELQKAFAAVLICLGSNMGPDRAQQLSAQISDVAAMMDRDGDPNTAKLTKGFADVLLSSHKQDIHH